MWSTICEIEYEPMKNDLEHNHKKIQRMHDAERDGALMCAALLMLSMVVMVIFIVYWLIV
nr:MAG TPA: hypothetical protein [Caudoviricetes sp.]